MRRVAVLVVALLLAAPWIGAERRDPQAATGAQAAWLSRVQRQIAAREYQASRSGDGLQAPNRAQGIRTWFEPTGVRVHERTAQGSPRLVELRLAGVGRGDGALAAVAAGEVVAESTRVEIRRPGMVEWYVNAPAGLEQGFTLAERPAGSGPLVLELAVAGASAALDGDAVALASEAGRRLRYEKLVVRDAAGALQIARLEVPSTGQVRIVVEDDRAAYPLVIDPLLTGEGFAATVLQSNQQNAYLGSSVAAAGDVNGDGYDDVIVGAPAYDAGQDNEGAAFVFPGSAAGIVDGDPSTAATVLESNRAYGSFGSSVAGAGDVDGDGYDDVIVVGPSYLHDGMHGAAFVFLGSAAGIADGDPSAAATVLESDQIGAPFLDVARAGDVNGDGYDDVIVGAHQYDAGQEGEGAAFVFLGSAAGIPDGDPSAAATVLESNQAYGQFGFSVAGAGDVNSDGYDDVIVGAWAYDAGEGNEGAAFVFLGSATGIPDGNPASAAAQVESNQQSAYLGTSVAAAGDVNGDGYDDVVVVAGGYEVTGGAAFVFLGGVAGIPDGNPATAATVLESNQAYGFFGLSVAGAGDVDGDGYDDVIVGAYNYRGEAGYGNEGAAFVFLGGASGIADGGPATAAVTLEPVQSIHFGSEVAGVGDVNGDGYEDVIVAAPIAGVFEGAAFVFLGNTCSNGVDDDGDGSTDHPTDPGCTSVADLSERAATACDDGLDDDGDDRVDFPSDPGCEDLADASERGSAACDDALDNDGDTRFDFPSDPGCDGPADDSERSTAICDDGLDNDGDTLIDHSDLGCADPTDSSERSASICDDGLDNDGDVWVDYPADSNCVSPVDPSEGPVACDDGLDNDGDGLRDFGEDPGCESANDPDETRGVPCENGLDDDRDGRVDYPSDEGCEGPDDGSEEVGFADGETHVIDASGSVVGDSVLVEPVAACGKVGCTFDGTELILMTGGTIDLDLAVRGESLAEVAGGEVGRDLLAATPSSLFDPNFPAQVRLTAGSVAGSVLAVGAAEVELLGGVVGGGVCAESDPWFWWLGPQLQLAGTEIGGEVQLRGRSVAAISGGVVGGDLEVWGSATVVVTGGQLLGDLLVLDEASVELRGTGFDPPQGEVAESSGRITGTLEDGTPLDVGFYRAPDATIRLVPAPGAWASGLAAALGLGLCARRASARI